MESQWGEPSGGQRTQLFQLGRQRKILQQARRLQAWCRRIQDRGCKGGRLVNSHCRCTSGAKEDGKGSVYNQEEASNHVTPGKETSRAGGGRSLSPQVGPISGWVSGSASDWDEAPWFTAIILKNPLAGICALALSPQGWELQPLREKVEKRLPC